MNNLYLNFLIAYYLKVINVFKVANERLNNSLACIHAYSYCWVFRAGHLKLYLSMNFRWEIVAFLCSFTFFFSTFCHIFFPGESLNFVCVLFLVFSGFYRRCLFFLQRLLICVNIHFSKGAFIVRIWCNGEQIFSLVISCWMAIFTFSIHRLFICAKSLKCTLYSCIQYRTLYGV